MRKKSAKLAAQRFKDKANALDAYCAAVDAAGLSKQDVTWAYDGALIKLAVAFEIFMLEALVSAVNNDTTMMSQTIGVAFPKHLTNEVCEYVVTGGGYFDFKGRSGLIGTFKGLLAPQHYLVVAVKDAKYKKALEQLIALRNFAAHESPQSKRKARDEIGVNLSAAGAWAKTQGRYGLLSAKLRDLASDIEASAPY